MVKIWSEWNVATLVLPVSAIVVLFWSAGLWTVEGLLLMLDPVYPGSTQKGGAQSLLSLLAYS